ncbi:phytanoyl-CoA hydroxylase-interacting protein-like isoform X2 [Patella vulgata]|uniref:phytanoyl-CoA hydroxylase-interacting protein-like isoform X2 n=1 Tax=Patella vulgata TaxID=6465 RepID=UPI00217FE4EF|nr:phytanoyl-CoA hydroxylase-interacting protein-like isoform X2 [Patella vulgata]
MNNQIIKNIHVLDIKQTHRVNVQWSKSHQVHHIWFIVYNVQTAQKAFHLFNLMERWSLAADYDTNATVMVTVYGLDDSSKVVISNSIAIFPNSKQIQDLTLHTHVERKSVLNPETALQEIPPENLPVDVNQEIHQDTQQPYTVFKITQKSLSSKHPESYIQIIKSNTTDYQQRDVQLLLDLAEKYRLRRTKNRHHSKSLPIPCLYRDKPSNHEKIIEAKATGVMSKYIKDKNGDQASSINKKINGLHFSASASKVTKQPLEISFFGDYRITIPPQSILPGHNLYFADFYCKKIRSPHYVTLVLTVPGSVEDVYCCNRLVKLDLKNNKFMYYDRRHGYRTTKAMHIEVLYTEDIDLSIWRQIPNFQEFVLPKENVRGRGRSRIEGLPKYTACETCNLPLP